MKNRAKVLKRYFRRSRGKQKDNVVEVIQQDIDKALERAKLLLSLENENVSKPLIIKAANTENENIRFKVVKLPDKTTRVDYNESLLTTIYLGTNSLFFHEAIVNHIHGYVLEDYASEVKYRDIVHVETFLDYEHRYNTVGLSSLYLLLHLINGTTIALNLRNHYMHNRKDYPELVTKEEKAIITNIQKAIRSVK